MEDQLITFETAKLAKEKGFDELLEQKKHVYKLDSKEIDIHVKSNQVNNWNDPSYIGICSAPTQSLLQKWLREKHDIHIEIQADFSSWGDEESFIFWTSYLMKIDKEARSEGFALEIEGSHSNESTYEQTLEEGLKQALKLI